MQLEQVARLIALVGGGLLIVCLWMGGAWLILAWARRHSA